MAISRRRLLTVTGGVAGVIAGAGALGRFLDPRTPMNYEFPDVAEAAPVLPATLSCPAADVTKSQAEGPYYRPNTPLRTVLREAGTVGIPLVIEGRVLGTDCRPIAGAVLDVWSGDGNGVYDRDGFNLRGHQFTDSRGAFRIETVRPSDYWWFGIHRTPHVHVKVQGRDTSVLMTQLYFPGESLNAHDWLFDDSLLLRIDESDDRSQHASFDFVLTRRDKV